MINKKQSKTVLGCTVAALAACWFAGGCDVTPASQSQRVSIAATANRAIDVAPGNVVSTSAVVSITEPIASDQRASAALSIDPDNIVIDTPNSARTRQAGTDTLEIQFFVDAGSGSACDAGMELASFSAGVSNGRVVSVDPPTVNVEGEIVDVLLGDSFEMCTRLQSTFAGSVTIRELTVEFSGQSNSNGNNNTNGNDNSNTNANGNDNGTGGDDNSNDNTNGNANGDDNANDNGNTNNNGDDSNNNGGDDGTNGNGDDNNNDNGAGNTNDNSDDNTNNNGDDNANDNGNVNNNANENADGTACIDGSFRVETELSGDGMVTGEMEYRMLPGGCERFRVKVEDMSPGTYDVSIDMLIVGTLSVGADGKGELEFDTEDDNIPADFPMVMIGDAGAVGDLVGGVLQLDCSIDDIDVCNDNGNTNANDNSNANGT